MVTAAMRAALQGGADGLHRGPDEQLRQVKTPGQPRGPVHKPVPALDEAQQAHRKEQYRHKHSLFSFYSVCKLVPKIDV